MNTYPIIRHPDGSVNERATIDAVMRDYRSDCGRDDSRLHLARREHVARTLLHRHPLATTIHV